jgi:predicted nucleotidyltransferase
MIDLRDKDRRAIIDIANRVFSVGTEIWAYGCRIKGTHHDASDLDLVIKAPLEQEFDLEQLVDFQSALQESTIPILVQVLSWQHIPEHFQQTILHQYEVLFVATDESR